MVASSAGSIFNLKPSISIFTFHPFVHSISIHSNQLSNQLPSFSGSLGRSQWHVPANPAPCAQPGHTSAKPPWSSTNGARKRPVWGGFCIKLLVGRNIAAKSRV
jgi:hypothetical protein